MEDFFVSQCYNLRVVAREALLEVNLILVLPRVHVVIVQSGLCVGFGVSVQVFNLRATFQDLVHEYQTLYSILDSRNIMKTPKLLFDVDFEESHRCSTEKIMV